MARIVMLLSNPYRPDPRVQREALSLTQAGHEVNIICWDRQVEFPNHEQQGKLCIQRIQSVRSTYAAGWRQVFYLPRFWHAAIQQAVSLQPGVLHCHDLDTLWAGWQIQQKLSPTRRKVKLIFDAHEDYPALMSLYLPTLLIAGLRQWEKVLLRKVDAIITASQVLADKYAIELSLSSINKKSAKQGTISSSFSPSITVIGNYQSLAPFDAIRPAQVLAARQQLGLHPEDYVVAYIGGFTRNRQLLPLIEAGRSIPDVKIILWGDGPQRQALEAAITGSENIRYLGWLPASEVPLYFHLADVIYYCLNDHYPGAIYNAPNTLSNAMAAGKPIIANPVGDLGRIVAETQCGILLSEVTPTAICQTIERLRNPTLRLQLGMAGRQAAEKSYNWSVAEKRLIEIYDGW